MIDILADKYQLIRDGGGRFFIDERGAFYKDRAKQEVQFVCFRICG